MEGQLSLAPIASQLQDTAGGAPSGTVFMAKEKSSWQSVHWLLKLPLQSVTRHVHPYFIDQNMLTVHAWVQRGREKQSYYVPGEGGEREKQVLMSSYSYLCHKHHPTY